MKYEIYIVDTETTGLDSRENDVIELSILRLSTSEQRTWTLKPINPNTIDPNSLRINGHKIEDLKWETKVGREIYKDPSSVLVDVENWIADDGLPAENRILCGQNIAFDREMLQQLWAKCNSKDTFPWGRRTLDTIQIEFFIDFCHSKLTNVDKMAEGYSLSNLVKKYGVKNEKAHTAAADVKATSEVFIKQVEWFSKVMSRALYNQDEGLKRRE
jgi:DNA polymerase III epsilon subunit-like protein